jgi:hypothetical protein
MQTLDVRAMLCMQAQTACCNHQTYQVMLLAAEYAGIRIKWSTSCCHQGSSWYLNTIFAGQHANAIQCALHAAMWAEQHNATAAAAAATAVSDPHLSCDWRRASAQLQNLLEECRFGGGICCSKRVL